MGTVPASPPLGSYPPRTIGFRLEPLGISDRNGEQRVGEPAVSPEDVFTFLRNASSYKERATRFEIIETHISWVFLTDRNVYKLKKPVRYDFLDYSTLELRRRACLAEIELNRRLAPATYVGLIPVVVSPKGQLAFGQTISPKANEDERNKCENQDHSPQPVEWLVKMRRLPADRTLEACLRAGQVDHLQIERLSQRLVGFFSKLPPELVSPSEYAQRLLSHVRANRDTLLELDQVDTTQIKRIHSTQMRMLRLYPERFVNRVVDGRLVEGHGDLRPEHIYFLPEVAIIDCVEFNREFRVLDVLDELSFLTMECDSLGAESIADQILQSYRQQSGDPAPNELVAFYKSYRAAVRAKVCLLRADQFKKADERGRQAEDSLRERAAKYLELADRYLVPSGKLPLLVVWGKSGTGKSTLAESIAAELELELIQTDKVRFERQVGQSAFDVERYSPQSRQLVYDEVFQQVEEGLKRGGALILDGTFLDTRNQSRVIELAKTFGREVLFVRCECPRQMALDRIQQRLREGGGFSEIQPEIADQQTIGVDTDLPDANRLVADTTQDVSINVSHIIDAIRTLETSASTTR